MNSYIMLKERASESERQHAREQNKKPTNWKNTYYERARTYQNILDTNDTYKMTSG